MERLSPFDYLHDPLPHWVVTALRLRLPRRVRTSALAVGVASTVFLSCVAIQHERLGVAERARVAARGRLDAVRARLASERIAAADVKSLLTLDEEIRNARASGYRHAESLAALAARLPTRSWLTELSPQDGGTVVGGRAETLGAIGELLEALTTARFGRVALQRVSRVEASNRSPIFEFTLEVERL